MTVSKSSFLLVFCVLLGSLAAQTSVNATSTNQPEDEGNSTAFVFPIEDPRHCGSKLKVLQVLPGRSWDNLKSKTVSDIVRFNYSECRQTSDQLFVIPDGVSAKVKEHTASDVIISEVFESMEGYYPAGTKALTFDPSLPSNETISGSFSDQFQESKTQQVVNDAITVRVQYQTISYSIEFDANFNKSFTPEFQDAVMAIADAVTNNDGRLAQYYADSLIGEFGTHFIDSLSVGGMVSKEDNIKATVFEKDEVIDTAILKVTAESIFQHELLGQNFTNDEKLQKWITKYNDATVSSTSTVFGGNTQQPFSINDWKTDVDNQLAAVELVGSSITNVITAEDFPNVSSSILEEVKKEVQNAFDRYYLFNTHFGCTDRKSPNFVFSANKDDGTCHGPTTNYTFGGFYQECEMYKADDSEDYCHKSGLQRRNPVTDNLSCPKGYSPIPLFIQHVNKDSQECMRPCNGLDCGTICFPKLVKLVSRFYWCAAHKHVPANSGAAFGGIYSSQHVNPVTGGTSCPVHFAAVRIGDVHVCISLDVEQAAQYAVPFGGFFSTQIGNPFTGPKEHGWRPSEWKHRCPTGYSQHMARINYISGSVSYCIAAGGTQDQHFLPLLSPPYSDKPKTNISLDSTFVFVDEVNGIIWYHKNLTDPWKNATTDEELKEAGLEGLIPLLDSISKNDTTTAGPETNRTSSEVTDFPHMNGTNTAETSLPVNNGTSTATEAYPSSNGTYMPTIPSTINSTAGAPPSGNGLSGGAIAAIAVVTTLVVIAAIGGAAYVYGKKRSQSRARTDSKSHLTSSQNNASNHDQGSH